MAGDWIKMRTSLLTNPKVNGIARELETSQSACGALSTRYGGVMHEIVTRNVMRHVTVSSLLVVWGAANEHTRDGVFHNADLSDIDDMTGIPGFGDAMESVGWALCDSEERTVTLPNFNEYNTSGRERSASGKSAAERQKEYRERKALQESDVTRDVTNDVTRNRREEKRREEKNSSSLRSEESAGKPVASRPKRSDKTLKTFLDECREAGIKPLPTDHPVRDYARDAGISEEMLQVAWVVFKDDYTAGTNKLKRYKDWPGHFANAVRGCWAKLWYTQDGQVAWTSRGQQEKAVLDARAKNKGDGA